MPGGSDADLERPGTFPERRFREKEPGGGRVDHSEDLSFLAGARAGLGEGCAPYQEGEQHDEHMTASHDRSSLRLPARLAA